MKQRVALLLYCFITQYSYAVRPFITDDARVVGHRLIQMESWLRIDRYHGQWWQMAAFGPTPNLELSLGGVFGLQQLDETKQQTAFAYPLLQGKYLFRPYKNKDWPGIGLVAGTFLPAGKGEFVPPGYGAFAFTTISQCFGKNENLLMHVNIGANYYYANGNQVALTWGIGTQVRTFGGFHLLGEVFSGDPYVPGTGLSYQVGFRHFFSDALQIDGTFGKGLEGVNVLPAWYSIGVRWVFAKY